MPFDNANINSLAFLTQVEEGLRPPRPVEPRRTQDLEAGALMRDDLWALVQQCWHGDKTMRPSAKWVHGRLADMNLTGIKCVRQAGSETKGGLDV